MNAGEEKHEIGLDAHVDHSLMLGGKKEEPGVAMSETQYERIQNRVRKEVAGGAASSIWLALAFAFASFGASAVLALETLDKKVVSGKVEGRLQAGAVGAAVLVLLCLVMHVSKWRRDRVEGNDICHEMDVYCHRTTKAEARPGWFKNLASKVSL
jgi:hypothetical protein